MFKINPKVSLRSSREGKWLVTSETSVSIENQSRIHSTQMSYTFQINYLKIHQKPICKM